MDRFLAGIVGIGMFIGSFFTAPFQVPKLQQQIDDLKGQLSQQEQRLGGFTPLQTQKFKLAGSGVTAAATSITLQSFQTIDGRDITMAMIGSVGYGTLEPNTSKEEQISFTGVTQNADDTAALTGVSRGLLFEYPYTASSTLQKAHAGSAIFVLSNTSGFYGQYPAKSSDETITGTWTFGSTTLPKVDGTPTYTSGDELEFVTYGQLASTSFAGTVDSSFSQKGVIELASGSELALGTATGSTGAYLVAPSILTGSTSAAKNMIPVTDTDGKLSQGFLDLTENYAWTGSASWTSNAVFGGNTSFSTTTSLAGPTTISGNASTTGTLTTSGQLNIASTTSITGNVTFSTSSTYTNIITWQLLNSTTSLNGSILYCDSGTKAAIVEVIFGDGTRNSNQTVLLFASGKTTATVQDAEINAATNLGANLTLNSTSSISFVGFGSGITLGSSSAWCFK